MITDIAFILCAGLGERLRPMTLATPKPLMPIWNKPLLAHTLEQLEAWGVREVYLNTHWLAEKIEAFVQSYQGPLKLHILHEPTVLGTGGALRALAPHLKGRPFWLVNGDVVFQVSPEPLIEAFHASGHFAAAWLEGERGPRTVEADFMGRITCWGSPTPGVDHTFTFTGVSLLSPEVLDFLPADKPVCSVVEAFNAAMYANKFVCGVTPEKTYWNDVGTPEAYVKAHFEMKRTPALQHYCTEANVAPAPAVEDALKLLKWKLEETIVMPLGVRGSQRSFWRLVKPSQSVMAIAYETEGRAENAKYAATANALAAAGVPVPKVLHDTPHLLILEDLGDNTLDKVLKERRAESGERRVESGGCSRFDKSAVANTSDTSVEAPTNNVPSSMDGASPDRQELRSPLSALRSVMELLAAFHAADVGELELEAPFDEALYNWECDLYETFAGALPPEAKAEWETVKAALLNEPPVLVHRDFQSTNILLYKKRPYVIDFQGMRRGPALYDLASFLYDPYVDWGEAAIEDAITAYAKAASYDEANLRTRLPYAGIQRLMQAIGAYYRLNSVGQPRFLAYVPIARKRAAALATAAGLPALATALATN